MHLITALLSLALSSPPSSVEPPVTPPVEESTVPDAPATTPNEAAPEPDEAAPEPDEAAPEPDEAAPEPDEAVPGAAPEPAEARAAAVDDEVAPMQAEVEPAPQSPAPRRRGIGLFIAGGLLGVAGLPLKIIATSSDTRLARELDAGSTRSEDCAEGCAIGPLFNVISVPLLITSAGLVSGGLHMHGRWAAHRDVTRGRLNPPRRTQWMTGVGVAAIGAGVATFIGSRIALRGPQASASATGYVSLRELGWWGGVVGVYAGAGLIGYATGYRDGQQKAQPRREARLAPLLSPQLVGLGMSGRF